MAKILNIEAITAPTRVLNLFGKEYPVQEMTVENFIKTTEEAERLKDVKNQGIQVSATVDMIMRSIPSIDAQTLHKLTLDQLLVIVRFVQGEMDDKIPDATGQPAPAPEADGKK